MPLFAFLFGSLSVMVRLIPHIPNVAPIGAFALWSGAYLPKRWGWSVPVVALLISDAIVGMYDWRLMAVVYGSFIYSTMIGWLFRSNASGMRILLGTLSGSLFFFISTNAAVWALSDWYPHTLQGVLWAYAMGLPFFRNSLLGDLFYSALFFGSTQITHNYISQLRFRTQSIPMFLRTLE